MTAIPTALPAFYPEQNSTLACTTATANVQVGAAGDTLMFKNEGSSTVFVSFGQDSTVTATAGGSTTKSSDGSYPLLGGEISTVRVDNANNVFVAGITASGTATLRITRGSGV